jgi:hypothetical protein
MHGNFFSFFFILSIVTDDRQGRISAVFGHPALVLRLGGVGVGAGTKTAAVWLLGLFPPLPAACFLGDFCFSVVCFFFSFLGSQSACVWVQFLREYFVG